jgi:hypothetical protein
VFCGRYLVFAVFGVRFRYPYPRIENLKITNGQSCVWCVVCGVWCGVVWCVVCGVWCVVWCGVWCVVCGVWCVVCGVWCVVCGVWCVVCVRCLVCGVWCAVCCTTNHQRGSVRRACQVQFRIMFEQVDR